MTTYSYDDGRVWAQDDKFEPYKLLLPYGMTDITDPVGSISLVREPHPGRRRDTVVVDTLRGEPGQNSFNIETRLKGALNYMFGYSNASVNFQAHLGQCERPDIYTASDLGIHLPQSIRGDMSIDRLAQIQGDNAVIAIAVPWTAYGMELIDFKTEFLSARTIAETENINDVSMLRDECGENIKPGYYGWVVANATAVAIADVLVTTDGGETFTAIVDQPFVADEHISSIVSLGTPSNHRVIVACGTTDVAAPAKVAYFDGAPFTAPTYVNVSVGSTNGQFINKLFLLDYSNVFAVCDDGQVYRSVDGGAVWSSVKAADANEAWDISAQNTGDVLSVSDADGVFLSEDFGATWTALTITLADGTVISSKNYTACEVTPDGTLYIGSDDGLMYGSADGGTTWKLLSAQGVTATAINAIDSYGDDNIYVALNISGPAGRVVRSTDGGATFRLWTLNIPTNTGVNAVDVIDANFAWVVGDAGFVTRTNSNAIGV